MAPEIACRELEDILEHRRLQPVFQPIFDTKTPVALGFEALIRGPANSLLHSPLALFDVAARCNRLADLEVLCRDISCEVFSELSLPGKLFLNVSPMTLTDPKHTNGVTSLILKKYGLSASRVVIEISEQYPLDDYELIRNATLHYRSLGYEIAIDDLGSGYSGLRSWAELQPEYVKIDRHFIDGIHNDAVKWEFVRSINEIAKSVGSKVIAEGIELEDELNAVANLGISLAQGYLLGRPVAQPSVNVPPCLTNFRLAYGAVRGVVPQCCIRELAQPCQTLTPDSLITEVAGVFRQQPHLACMPVLDGGGRPVGIVGRIQLLELMSQRFSHELYRRDTVSQHMQADFLCFDGALPLAEASRFVTDAPERDLNLDLIITEGGVYAGVARTRQLLRRITELQLRSARYANPLTLLPGSVPLYEHIDALLAAGVPFTVARCDINQFKPFNDAFGYDRGDDVIKGLADILGALSHRELDFIGHTGGDDFTVVFTSPAGQEIGNQIVSEFQASLPRYYDVDTLQAGGHWATDRSGNPVFHGLIGLVIGMVVPDPGRCFSHHDVVGLAQDALRQAKMDSGPVFVSRRRGPASLDWVGV